MDPHTLIDEFTKKISDLVARTPVADVEKNARALLSSLLAKADLVTREEFDRQTQVLARTREKLSELEAKVATWEAQQGK
ncbi:accessory factor UbiK family protein [Ferrovum sp.]|uniref:accessory factor UbiK family protein n=1 Tax=Ferrovum sp. TaxID=2609467 RepID=UPI002615D6BC|nr:accessory factor UbiK family protein [Ferrovum sp.]